MARIHPLSVIHPGATLGKDVSVGPFCTVGEHVVLGDGVTLISHVALDGRTTIGEGTQIFPFASIGHVPQDLKFKGELSTLEIGAFNIIREHVTMNPGTEGGGMLTRVGDRCLFMMGAHVAHDCLLGNHVIMANNATLAGHVEVGDYAFIGGLSAVHQFVRIGRHAMIGGMSGVEADVIPFGLVMGERAGLAGLNLVGLKRRNFDRDTIHGMRSAYRDIFEDNAGTLQERAEKALSAYQNQPDIRELIEFILSDSKRSICV
jgi:UDP-N-acetylglucosamine acyltransferase